MTPDAGALMKSGMLRALSPVLNSFCKTSEPTTAAMTPTMVINQRNPVKLTEFEAEVKSGFILFAIMK
jgi:hypothetical protein